MSQDQDPIDATRRFEPVDPYNIPPEQAGVPTADYEGYQGYQQGFEQPYGAPSQPPQGFKQRLTRLGPLKLALLGTAGVIVLGGAAWGTTAALQSGSSSSNTAATAPATDQSSSPAPGAGATSGGTGKHAKQSKPTRIKITEIEAGTIWGTDPKGAQVTVVYDATTKFGTKKNPLKPEQLDIGKEIAVAGTRSGDTITATSIEFINPKEPHGPATPGDGATPPTPAASPSSGDPTDPASPIGGNA